MTWAALSATHLGSRHAREGRPNQDAHRTLVTAHGAVAAVADGHGHHAHPRSGTGALLAAQAVTDLLGRVLPELVDVTTAETVVRERVAPALVTAWRAAVEQNASAAPFPRGEQPANAEETWLRYGTTLIALAATEAVVVVLQLGDGNSVVVSQVGDVCQPLPEDELLDGTRTTSMCQPDPLASLRVVALPAADVRVAYVCTDGFGKPQLDEEWWRQVGTELAQRAAEHGTQWLADRLPGWLEEPATVGGDDTTMAVLVSSR